MKTNNFALRLPDSLYTGLKQAAAADNVAMNQYLTIALAEKLSARATAAAFSRPARQKAISGVP